MADDPVRSDEFQRAARDVESGSVSETLTSAAAVILGILGLIGILPGAAASIAAIAAGLAVMIGAAALAGRAGRLIGGRIRTQHEISGGLNLAALAGVAGIILGVLALLTVSRIELLGIVPIVLGGGLVIASVVMARFEQLLRVDLGSDAVLLASGAEALVGCGAIILGILALIGISPLTLTLIALIGIGAALFSSGSSMASQLALFRSW